MSKQPSATTQAVGALLRKAGYEASKGTKSRIKGLREYSKGYVLEKGHMAEFFARLTFRNATYTRSMQGVEEKIVAFEKLLSDAGYVVVRGDFLATPNPQGLYLMIAVQTEA